MPEYIYNSVNLSYFIFWIGHILHVHTDPGVMIYIIKEYLDGINFWCHFIFVVERQK